jgi:hypothetical protein
VLAEQVGPHPGQPAQVVLPDAGAQMEGHGAYRRRPGADAGRDDLLELVGFVRQAG